MKYGGRVLGVRAAQSSVVGAKGCVIFGYAGDSRYEYHGNVCDSSNLLIFVRKISSEISIRFS